MRKKLTYILFLIASLSYAQEEYHFSDLIIRKNDTTEIYNFPLSCHPELKINELFFEKGIRSQKSFMSKKNYQAEWKIIEDKLFLSNIYSGNYYIDNFKADLDSLFSNYKDGLVFANWYSGTIFMPQGDYIIIERNPLVKVHESESEFTFKDGVLVKSEFTNNNFFKSIYTEDSQNLIEFIEKQLDIKKLIESDKEIVRFTILIKTGSSQNDFSVNIKGNLKESEKNEIIKVVKQLPNFDYYHSKGKDLKRTLLFTVAYKN